jgi:hypothetical protein
MPSGPNLRLWRGRRASLNFVDGLNAAKEAFNTQVPAEAMDALQTGARDEAASAQRLRASGVAWFFANLHALPDLRQRIALIKQVVLPPAAYMMEKYQTKNRLALPFLYGYRSIKGVLKSVKRLNPIASRLRRSARAAR